jgi:hypothetical protein
VRNMRLKYKIMEYVQDKDKVRLRDLIDWLDVRKNKHGPRSIAGNLVALGWKQERRLSDVYRKV